MSLLHLPICLFENSVNTAEGMQNFGQIINIHYYLSPRFALSEPPHARLGQSLEFEHAAGGATRPEIPEMFKTSSSFLKFEKCPVKRKFCPEF
jgi:hypothetical protein